jgi:hypothetical protein
VRGSSPFVELLAAPRDTIAPRLLTVTAEDTLTLSASFDRPLDLTVPLTTASFRVESADSARLRIASVQTRAQVQAAERARQDSIARVDTTARRDIPRARPDTLGPRVPSIEPKPSKPAPPREIVLKLDPRTPMRRGAPYRITAVNVRGLLGQTRTSDRVITIPVPVPAVPAVPRARQDSAGVRRP